MAELLWGGMQALIFCRMALPCTDFLRPGMALVFLAGRALLLVTWLLSLGQDKVPHVAAVPSLQQPVRFIHNHPTHVIKAHLPPIPPIYLSTRTPSTTDPATLPSLCFPSI